MTGLRKLAFALGLAGAISTSAMAGSIYLTGHDTLLHDGAEGYDNVILDFLRGAGTGTEIAKASYDIAVLGSNVGFWGWSDVPGFGDEGTKPGYASTTFFNVNTLDDAGWGTALSADVLVILSHTSCGGCDLDDAGVIAINARSAQIATAFNAGMDIWGNSGASNADYYDFLPPGVTTSGPPISGSSGFIATAAGLAIGITPEMINGDPTHNRFVDFADAFTVFEVRPNTSLPGGNEVISIGVRDGTIVDDGIVVDDGGDDGGTIPEPATLGLLGLGLLAFGFTRRRKQ